jgi:hypothetical protein
MTELLRRISLDFQINDETYFLELDERRWQVLVSTATGARSVPVYEDAAEFDDFTLVVEDKERRKIPN